MATTRTTTELATAVLRKLVQIDATEDATDHTEAQTVVTNAYNDKYYELRFKELTYWTQTTIPVEVFPIIRDLVALDVSGHFGQPVSDEEYERREEIILKRLRRITGAQHSKNRTKALYY
jgi:hypothetical protein